MEVQCFVFEVHEILLSCIKLYGKSMSFVDLQNVVLVFIDFHWHECLLAVINLHMFILSIDLYCSKSLLMFVNFYALSRILLDVHGFVLAFLDD